MDKKIKKPIWKKWWFWLIVVFVVIGIGGGTATNKKDSGTPSTSSSTTATSSTKSTKDVLNVTIDELKTAYSTGNAIQADSKYKDKYLRVTGPISKVTEGIIGGYDIDLDGGALTGNQFMTVTLTFNTSDKDKAMALQNGSQATLVGKLSSVIVTDGTDSGENWPSLFNFTNATIE